jgi:hypothetical protein
MPRKVTVTLIFFTFINLANSASANDTSAKKDSKINVTQSNSISNTNIPGQSVILNGKKYKLWSTEDDPALLRARRSQSFILPEVITLVPLNPP